MKRTINLVKAAKNPVRVRRQADKLYTALSIVVAAMLLAVAITALAMNITISSNREKVRKLDAQIATLEKQIAGQAEYKATYQFLKKYNADMTSVLEIIKLSPKVSEAVFTSIDESLLPGIHLSKFRIDTGMIYLSAYSAQADDLVLYVENLRAQDSFFAVSWKSAIRFEEDIYVVDLSLIIQEVKS